MKWITSGDLKNWPGSNKKHCESTLPELVRRLIFATANNIEDIDFPSGDGTASGGWDGHLRTPVTSPFFPQGVSAWEIGTNNTPGVKADEDYEKRVTDSGGVTPLETTFVFVTPRNWPQRLRWESAKKAAGDWKDVKVIAADKLEEWLDSAPAVALWLARQIKGLPDGIRDLEYLWEEWSESTEPRMTVDLVVSGRVDEAEKIRKWVTDNPSLLEVRGDSPDEPAAFLYASLSELSEIKRLSVLSRCIVVENIQQFRTCVTTFQNPLVIVAPADCRQAAGLAIKNGHHVFLCADTRAVDFHNNLLELSRPKRNIVQKNLIEIGISEARAQKLARDFGRSIPVLRRHLSRLGTEAPSWADSESAQVLLPFLLAGSWDESKEADRKVIEALSAMKYEAYSKKVNKFLALDDAPIRKIGSVWMLTSPLDAWFLLAPHLDESILKLFKKALESILTKTDPKYELPSKDRWAAAVYGKASPFSEWLQTGLVESLVLLAVYGNRAPKVSSTQAFADYVVKEILAKADKWEMWASLKEVTPPLAEASPESFLEAVDEVIQEKPALFVELMKDEGGVFGECKHSGLLWALEALSWSAEYLPRSAILLERLAKIDKGGNWNNRPMNTLRDIFFPQLPQTFASPKERLIVLDQLTSKDPKLVWDFIEKYFVPGSISQSYRFKWREMGGERLGLQKEAKEDYAEYVGGILERARRLACHKVNTVAVMDNLIRLPEDIADEFLASLEKSNPSKFSKEQRILIFTHTRETIHWISNYDKEGRSILLPVLKRILKKFTPEDYLEGVSWLFTGWPDLPKKEPKEYDKKTALINKERGRVAREILKRTSLKKIIQFAKSAQYSGVFGQALGKTVKAGKEDDVIVDALMREPRKLVSFIQGYAQGRVTTVGKKWIDQQFKRLHPKKGNITEGVALLYFGLPEGPATWKELNLRGKEVENAYWKYASAYIDSKDSNDIAVAVGKLLDVKRCSTALDIAGTTAVSLPSALLQRLIQEILFTGSENKDFQRSQLTEYHLGHIFKQLHERNELSIEELTKLEWPFAKLFQDIKKYIPGSLAIHQLLKKDPAFFAELVSFMYKRDDRESDPVKKGGNEEMVHFRGENAWEVLNTWTDIPGLKKDGSLDSKELSDWVQMARQECTKTNHVTGGDLQIGFMLAHSPSGDDGIWPHPAVRNLLEVLNNRTIERHIETGVYNNRGVVSRGLDQGGKSEREIAEKYKRMSEETKVRWPRTAAMLKSMSESYSFEAKREDLESDLRDFQRD